MTKAAASGRWFTRNSLRRGLIRAHLPWRRCVSSFGLRHSFVIRHSSFVIPPEVAVVLPPEVAAVAAHETRLHLYERPRWPVGGGSRGRGADGVFLRGD